MNLVAFTGQRGHGKTTAAEVLFEHDYRHLCFADPLRRVVNAAYRISFEEMADPVLKERRLDRFPYKSPREVLQFVGTDMFRTWIPDTWIENWKGETLDTLAGMAKRPDGTLIDANKVVCSDVRFLNEAEAVRALGGTIIRIINPRLNRTDAASQHASETELEQIVPDWTITNDRGIHDLQQAVQMLVLG